MIRLVLVGTGNVSIAIAKAVRKNSNIRLVGVIGKKNKLNADYPINASYTNDPNKLPDCDLILIAVQDQVIEDVSNQLPSHQAVVAHTSGASSVELLSAHKHRGVWYPIQTFSKKSHLNWENIPVCWEASTSKAQEILQKLATSIGVKTTVPLDQQKRTVLHLGAVLVNNFSNSLYESAYQLFAKHQLHFDLLKPLILETAHKIIEQTPAESQTGPARRGDKKTIEKHMSLIEDTALLELYKTFTNQLLTAHQHEEL